MNIVSAQFLTDDDIRKEIVKLSAEKKRLEIVLAELNKKSTIEELRENLNKIAQDHKDNPEDKHISADIALLKYIGDSFVTRWYADEALYYA